MNWTSFAVGFATPILLVIAVILVAKYRYHVIYWWMYLDYRYMNAKATAAHQIWMGMRHPDGGHGYPNWLEERHRLQAAS